MAEELGVLKVSLELDDSNFSSTVTQVNAKLNALMSEFKATSTGVEDFEKSVEGMRVKVDNLTKILELQQIKASSLKKEYERLTARYGENSIQAQRMLTKYNNLISTINKTQSQLNSINEEIEKNGNRLHKLSQKFEGASTSLSAFGDQAKNVGGTLSAGLTTSILAAGKALVMISTQFEDAQVKIQNGLGTTSEEAKNLANISENIWAQGFGDSLEEVSNALIQVKQNMKGISDEAELEKITRDALLLAKTFDSDLNEVTRAGQNVMHHFGVSSQQALDGFAKAAQKGANFSKEMFDNISEYAPLVAKAGYSFEEYLGIVTRASSEGIYNLGYINELITETQTRLKDGSKKTADAMAKLSDGTNKVWEAFLNGEKTVEDVISAMVPELKNMEDQTLANQIAVGIMGTKFRDIEAESVYAILGVNEALDDTVGTMDKMAKAQEQTFNQRWQSLLRQAHERLEPVGQEILDIAEDWLPKLAEGLERAVGWFSDLSEEGQGLIVKLAGIAAAAGPLLAGGGMFVSGASNVLKLGSSLASTAAKGGLLATTLGAFTGPVGIGALAVGAIGALTFALVKAKDSSTETAEEMLKLQEETFNTQMKSYEAARSNVELANSYDQLRDKSSLTVDELLRYKEIQSQLETTTSAEKVAVLKDELSKLQEKSGLTNEEIARMLELDQKIIDTVPGVEAAYDSKGNAVVEYSDAVKKVTQAQFELQKAEAMSTLTETIEGLDEQIGKLGELREEYITLSETKTVLEQQALDLDTELKAIDEERKAAKKQGLEFDEQAIEVYIRQKEISQELKDIRKQQKDATGEQLEILKQQEESLLNEREILNGANGELMTREEYLKEALRLNGEELATTIEKVNETSQEKALIEEKIALTKLQYEEILNALAGEVGITAEEGKQLEAMRAKYEENQKEISQLETKNKSAQGLTEKERNRLEELKKQNEQIGINIEEAETLNSTLSKDVRKEIGIDDNGEVDEMNKEASKTITKPVQFKKVTTGPYSYSSAIESLFVSPATKYVKFRAQNSLPSPFSNYQGISSFEGGNTFVGELGVERAVLPSGKRIDLGVNGMELVNLPKGTRIYNHLETAKMDGLLPANANTTVFKDFNLENKLKNTKWFAEGGIVDSPTIFGRVGSTLLGAGEAGPEAIAPIDKLLGYVRTAVRDEIGSSDNEIPDINVTVQNVYNNKVIDEVFYPRINKKLATDTKQYNYMRGGRIK